MLEVLKVKEAPPNQEKLSELQTSNQCDFGIDLDLLRSNLELPYEDRLLQHHAAYLLYLKTDLGVLDVLGELPPLGELKDIFNRSEKIRVFGYEIKVLSIDDLITSKKALGREKELLMIKELEKIKS